jgi:hypothetical protein
MFSPVSRQAHRKYCGILQGSHNIRGFPPHKGSAAPKIAFLHLSLDFFSRYGKIILFSKLPFRRNHK